MMVEKKVLRIQEVIDSIGLSRSSIYRMIKLGKFPQPISLSTRRVGFISEDVSNWIEKQKIN